MHRRSSLRPIRGKGTGQATPHGLERQQSGEDLLGHPREEDVSAGQRPENSESEGIERAEYQQTGCAIGVGTFDERASDSEPSLNSGSDEGHGGRASNSEDDECHHTFLEVLQPVRTARSSGPPPETRSRTGGLGSSDNERKRHSLNSPKHTAEF